MIHAKEKFDIDYIDSSSICDFNRCPAMYCMSRQMGLNSRSRKRLPMDYGTDMHESLPYMYKREDISTGLQIFTDNWNARGYGITDKARNIDTAHRSLENFANQHIQLCPYEILNFPNITALDCDRISKNELPFLIDVGADLCLAGRIDAPVEWIADKTLFALDYKTASEVSPRFFKNFDINCQAICYALALSQITGRVARGFIVEAIRTSEKRSESQMHMVFVKEHQMLEHIETIKYTAEEILKCNEKQEWPTRYCGCAPYGMFGSPGYMCDFATICDSPDHDAMMKFYEKKEPFSPFKIQKG